MAIKDVLRSLSEPPYGMPSAEGTGVLPEERVPDWLAAGGPPPAPDFPFISVMDVDAGKPALKENPLLKIEGKAGEGCADGLKVTGDGDGVNAIVVNSGEYKLTNMDMSLKGDGLNDFDGIGAGVMSRNESVTELRDCVITTAGVIRPCTFVRDEATLKVYNCTLTGEGGTLPDDYVPIPGPGMKMPPSGLKITGNCRTHLSVGNSRAYFYDSRIVADGWAALSTDGCTDELYLEANNCDVICRNSGYGVYSDGGCVVCLNGSRITTATHTAIMAGDCRLTLNDCDAKSGQYNVMMHCVMGCTSEVGKLYIKGSRLEAKEIPLFIKSTNAYVGIENSEIKSESGLLVHSILNDDECATKVGEDEYDVYGIKISVKASKLSGSIVHGDTDRTMSVTLTDSELTGGVQNAYMAFAGASKWTADADSQVCLVGVKDTGSIDALSGVTIRAVAGKGTELKGQYALKSGGKLVIE